MTVSSVQAQKVLTGNHNFTQFGFSMLITRLKFVYTNDKSPTVLQNCVNEINAFMAKYASVMAADFAVISKL